MSPHHQLQEFLQGRHSDADISSTSLQVLPEGFSKVVTPTYCLQHVKAVLIIHTLVNTWYEQNVFIFANMKAVKC